MDFELTEEQKIFQRVVRDFCEKKVFPKIREIDTSHRIPEEIIEEMAGLGLLGVMIPEEYGGAGGNHQLAVIGGIEIGRGDLSAALPVYYLLNNAFGYLIYKYGKESLKRRILPKVTSGEAFIGMASTEPQSGSDIANFRTIAEKHGDTYVVNGEKAFITGINEIKRLGDGGFVTVVKTNPQAGHKGISLLYVPLDLPGIETEVYEDMGRMGISTGGIRFNNVEVPDDYLIGEENKGMYLTLEGLNTARVLVSAGSIGIAEKALELGTDYIKQRKVFGKPIGKYEGIQFELAELHSQVEMIKTMIYKAAWMLDEQEKSGWKKFSLSEVNRIVAIIKLFAPQIAFKSLMASMVWHGAISYTKDLPLEAGLRGVFSWLAGADGALNIMKIIIARELLGKDYLPYRD